MKNFKTIITRLVASRWAYPLALLIIGIVAYGLMFPRLGFYWDDWEGVYLYHLHNPGLAFHFYSERPFSALVFLGLFPLIKLTPAVMHAVALLLRWGGILFIYQTLNLLWPGRKWIHQWVGALLIVFPGFSEQPVSVAFTPHLATFLLFSCSLFLTALALRDKKRFWLWMPFSVLTGIAQIFMMEYFVVLEILRPLMIWFILRDEQEPVKRALTRTLLTWLPFLAGLALFLWWRLAYLPAALTGGDPNNPALLAALLHSPLNGLVSLVQKIIGDLRYLFTDIWINAFMDPIQENLVSKIIWVGWFLGFLAAILFARYTRGADEGNGSVQRKTTLQPLYFGVLAFLTGGVPVWLTDRQASLGKWSDRFSLAPMIGIVILVVWAIDWFFRTGKQKQWLLIALLGFSISFQFWNANSYRLDWDLQRNIYWQLAWRAPALAPGTTIIGKGTFTGKSSYYDGTYIMNLLFDPKPAAEPSYGYLDVFHIFPDEAGDYQGGQPISISTRSGQFNGTTSQALGMYFTLSQGCVRILDGVYLDDPVLANDMSSFDRLNRLIAISNVNLIENSSQPVKPDRAVFGAEPAHGWCYYFEKADLARQVSNWQTVLEMGSQAQSQGLRPAMGVEYLPFIEAYARTGEWSKAYELSAEALTITRDLGPNLCINWTRFGGINGGTERDKFLSRAKSEFCGASQ